MLGQEVRIVGIAPTASAKEFRKYSEIGKIISPLKGVTMESTRQSVNRNIFAMYVLFFVTFGIYGLVWTVKSKHDIKSEVNRGSTLKIQVCLNS